MAEYPQQACPVLDTGKDEGNPAKRGTDGRFSDDRLKKDGVGFLDAILESHDGCKLEGHFRGIDFMGLPIIESDLHIDDGIAAQDTALHGL